MEIKEIKEIKTLSVLDLMRILQKCSFCLEIAYEETQENAFLNTSMEADIAREFLEVSIDAQSVTIH